MALISPSKNTIAAQIFKTIYRKLSPYHTHGKKDIWRIMTWLPIVLEYQYSVGLISNHANTLPNKYTT